MQFWPFSFPFSPEGNNPPPNRQSIHINGNDNSPVQIQDSPHASVAIQKIDPDELARKLAEKLPDSQSLREKDQEIATLKATIERLEQAPGDARKQAALQALAAGEPEKATELLEQAAQVRTKQASQD